MLHLSRSLRSNASKSFSLNACVPRAAAYRALFHSSLASQSQYFSTTNMSASSLRSGGASSLASEITALVETNGWTLEDEGQAISKTFYFKNYTKCLDFSSLVGIRSKAKSHHATMTIKYGSVHLHWCTHQPPGLSDKDTSMARYCDEQAQIIGAVGRSEGANCSN